MLKQDRLIKLPDDLLLNILERVGTLDAIRACLISKRTLNLPAKLSEIDIVLSCDDLRWMNDDVAGAIEKILRTRSAQVPVRKIKVRFLLRLRDCLSIGNSVALAAATQKLDAAEFEISTQENWCNADELVSYAKQFNAFFGACPDAFAALTRLHLQDMRLGESDLRGILCTCKRLESLGLYQCDAGIGSVLQIEHATLVELDINHGSFKTVRLSFLPKLERLTYANWLCNENPLVLCSVPRLSKLNLKHKCRSDMTIMLSDVLAKAPSITDLLLDFRSEKVLTQIIPISYLLLIVLA
jgi:hypothetical protein